MSDKEKTVVLRSSSIFTATEEDYSSVDGFIVIRGETILVTGKGDGSQYRSPGVEFHDLGSKTICPGFTDTHCFFGGHAMKSAGADLSGLLYPRQVAEAVLDKSVGKSKHKALLGHGLAPVLLKGQALSTIAESFEGRPAVLFSNDGDNCWMNEAARARYGFDPDHCYPEAYWRLLAEILSDIDFIIPTFIDYMALLNARGVTAVKDMAFDDYYGFADTLHELARQGRLRLHFDFMSQPVGRPLDLRFAEAQRLRFSGAKGISFSGFNRMTDGSISQLEGDLKADYSCSPGVRCAKPVDYAAIEREVLAADARGFRFSLHAQGDSALAHCLDIYERCSRTPSGGLINRHAITDLELSDPSDLARMGRLGVIAEIYPQILSLYSGQAKRALIETRVGSTRSKRYWDRRSMLEQGVRLTCATDLPLLYPDISDSIYRACGGYFNDEDLPFNKQNTIAPEAILRAWTTNGAYALHQEKTRGTLSAGKLADIVIFDTDILTSAPLVVKNSSVLATLKNGKIVYGQLL